MEDVWLAYSPPIGSSLFFMFYNNIIICERIILVCTKYESPNRMQSVIFVLYLSGGEIAENLESLEMLKFKKAAP